MINFKKLGYLLIIIAPLDFFTIPFPIINLSLFRISLLVYYLLFFFKFTIKPKLKKTNKYIFLFFIFLSSIIGIMRARTFDDSSSVFFNEIMGITLIFLFINVYNHKDINNLLKSYLWSMFIPILLSIYTYFHLIFLNTKINNIFGYPLDEGVIHRMDMGKFIRLSLPFGSPPHLSLAIISAIIILMYYLFKEKINCKKILLLLLLLAVFIGTLTRTTIISLALSLIIILFIVIVNKDVVKRRTVSIVKKKKLFKIILISFIGLSVFTGSIFVLPDGTFNKLVRRFSELQKNSRHFLVIYEGFNILSEKLSNFFLGIGTKGSIYYQGVYAHLPPHFLNSYLTILVERGVIGFFLYYGFYFILLIELFLICSKNKNRLNLMLLLVLINILISFLGYELRGIIPIWILTAIMTSYLANSNLASKQIARG
jgi:O-antigen ligase